MYPTVLVAAVSIERLTGNQTIQTVHGLTQNAPSGPEPPPVHIRVDLDSYVDTNAESRAATASLPSAIDLECSEQTQFGETEVKPTEAAF